MARLSKTAIEYLASRLNVIAQRTTKLFNHECKLRTLTEEEKMGFIIRGEAEPTFSPGDSSCPHGSLTSFFKYPGDDERIAINQKITSIRSKFSEDLLRTKEYHIDSFVLAGESETKVITQFEKYCDSTLKKTLKSIEGIGK